MAEITIEELQGLLTAHIDTKVAAMKNEIYASKTPIPNINLEEFERMAMAHYSGIKALDHSTFRLFLRSLMSMLEGRSDFSVSIPVVWNSDDATLKVDVKYLELNDLFGVLIIHLMLCQIPCVLLI